MIKPLKLAFLFLIAGTLVGGLYGADPPAIASHPHPTSPRGRGAAEGGTDSLTERTRFDSRSPLAERGLGGEVAARRTPPPTPPRARGGERIERSSLAAGFTDADFATHVEQLKKKLPSSDFTIVVQKPFVVIGDEPAEDVKAHSIRTVKWAVDKLKQEYFTKDPNEILDIWLFKDAASYERNAQLLFGSKPTTPYGYYSSTHKALVMNISTGGGTLVHEIVHPFIEANFPNAPPWLNEGLGSLYEQSGEVNGRIHGFTNWRLPGLQSSIKARRVPLFRTLLGMNQSEFYDDDRGTHYAQARYLLYYLQQKGLLRKFYAEFHKHQQTDRTGYQTLRRVLGNPDMKVFQSQWEKYVLGLRQG